MFASTGGLLSFHQPAASIVLSQLQTTNSLASESAVDQLARASRALCELRRENCLPLFRCGTGNRTAFSCNLGKVSVAGSNRVLDFCLLTHRRNFHRL